MKGVILAGGTGSRLYPVTKVVNKHLLPVYNRPLIYYPIETMKKTGITDIMVVLGGESVGELIKLLGSGEEFGVKLTYRYQEGAGGIAQALGLAEDFIGNEKMMVILGDNIIEDNLKDAVTDFLNSKLKAGIFLKEVSDPERFGIAEIKNGKVKKIEEKPENPKSNFAVTGIYLYDSQVFEIIKALKPSDRGELEITDVNNAFILQNSLKAYYLKGYWIDAGKFESLYRATSIVAESITTA
ncbi:spore coat protein [Anoxybacter fermentans]|uniref:Glucose-1-phosphate thymidylyltransferase n=1 Tax=Anoxybacter fermentans TaxID=1323375 RepID=A0A3Q9HND6_9FIRM|nr:sugar phosphate nucleotidyltransferase [Anoxybacter fermentans]AZR72012.1 spore coat protein [Anoxybacter fermentans]